MTETIMTIQTLEGLKSYLHAKERTLTESFTFLPKGTLARSYPGEKIISAISDAMSFVNKVSITRHMVNHVLQKLTVTVRYRPCVRMLAAWKSGRRTQLTVSEQQALQTAEALVRSIRARRSNYLEQLYLLYSYVGSTITYRSGRAAQGTDAYRRYTDCDSVLLRREGNCQGHSEIMFLCGSMLGFTMGIQGGESNGGGHCWNTVSIGRHTYAMDATAKINGEEKNPTLKNTIYFLMGQREADENGLHCTALQQVAVLSPTLAPEHDIYRILGMDFSTADAAARYAWNRYIAGERQVQLRISARGVTPETFSAAMKRVASEPALQKQIFSCRSGNLGYYVGGVTQPAALYVTVEWKA